AGGGLLLRPRPAGRCPLLRDVRDAVGGHFGRCRRPRAPDATGELLEEVGDLRKVLVAALGSAAAAQQLVEYALGVEHRGIPSRKQASPRSHPRGPAPGAQRAPRPSTLFAPWVAWDGYPSRSGTTWPGTPMFERNRVDNAPDVSATPVEVTLVDGALIKGRLPVPAG